jgi:mannan endo-1,4-beta-mannosidase
VLWMWSPNFIGASTTPKQLRAAYPGNKYVDWVGIDGYYNDYPKQTFNNLFGPTVKALDPVAKSKPFLVAETAVGATNAELKTKPKQITNLLSSIAKSKQFNGLVYFDFYTSGLRSNWLFQQTKASLRAFKAGIHSKSFAAAKPGSL